MNLLYLLLLPFAGSLVAAFMPTHARNAAATWAALVGMAALIWVISLYPYLPADVVLREEYNWIPSAGINFTLRVDGFAWMFALLVTGIGTLVAIYARYYMSRDDPVPRFFSFFLAFMGAMLGIVLSGNLVQLVFFWELTSIVSFLLIGYWHHRRDARRGARMALIITEGGGLALLGGILILGHIAGSYDLDLVLQAGTRITAHPLYPLMLTLVLLGALAKSAQFPLHFWLPQAMAAPTPVSAYLHSATMVKAGVFLLARLWPALSGTPEWFWLVSSIGLATLVLGAAAAMFQNDLKGLLAYSTISHLGLITLLLGLNGRLAAVAAVFHIINHATFKASLFMAAGIIDHETGTRDMRRLTGLRRAMPVTGALAFVASAAMAGVPLLNGFLSKEMFFSETVAVQSAPWVNVGLPIVATIAGVFTVVYSLRFAAGVFLGPEAQDLPRAAHEPKRWMRVPIEVLVLVCLLVGVVPQWSIGLILSAAATPVVGGALPVFDLAIWHGFSRALMMSLIALAGGTALYLGLYGGRWQERRLATPPRLRLDAAHMFHGALHLLDRAARRLLKLLSTRRLQPQILFLVLAAVAVGLASLWPGGITAGDRPRVPASLEFALLWLVGGTAAVMAAQQAKFHRLAALVMVGVVGLCVSLTFLWFSAPDLALTQLTVEVVTTALFLLGLRWLPKRRPDLPEPAARRATLRRGRDLLVAIASGGGLALLSFAMLTRSAPQSISPFYLERALPEGGGSNVVNVMLVDFRGFDTFGEITVLAIVAITVYALLRRFRPPQEMVQPPPQQRMVPGDLITDLVNPRTARDTALGYLQVPAILVRLLMPVAIMVAIYVFLRGHDEPGGGFVAGLLVAIAFLSQYLVGGTYWVEAHFRLRVMRWVGIGLLLALLTGAGAMVVGFPFLTSHSFHFTLPLLGEIHLASALFFDAGVFSVVVGATLLILTAIAHQSVRSQRRSPEPEPESESEPAHEEGPA